MIVNYPNQPKAQQDKYMRPTFHKYFFGSYLNLARHNAYLILHFITEEANWEKQDAINEDALQNAPILSFSKRLRNNPTERRKITKALVEHFKFLWPMSKPISAGSNMPQKEGRHQKDVIGEPDPSEVVKSLRSALVRLNELRNYFSHYYNQAQPPKAIFKLEPVFDAAVERLLVRFGHEIAGIKEEHICHLRRPTNNLDSYNYVLTKPDGRFKEMGLYYFICLFLQPAEANRFLSRLWWPTPAESPVKNEATRKCFMNYCCKLPEPKLESSDVKLDMLNELSRCPKELYEVISSQDKEMFMVEADPDPDLENTVRKVTMKRKKDRFHYFALRYFDEYQHDGKPFLPTIRFQIRLGRLRTRENPANKGTREMPREFIKDLSAFGRLADFQIGKLPKTWLQKNKETGQEQLHKNIEHFAPGYQLTGNRIAFKFVSEQYHPWQNIYDLVSKIQSKSKNEVVVVNEVPDAILSAHELQNLFFYQYLHHKGQITDDVETFIKSYLTQFRKFTNDVAEGIVKPYQPKDFIKKTNGYHFRNLEELENRKEIIQEKLNPYGLKMKDLPDRLKEYLLGYTDPDYTKAAMAKLIEKTEQCKSILRETSLSKEALKANPNAPKKERPLKAGELADQIAADINYLKPPGKDKKARAEEEQFRRLQEHLAYFSIRKKELEDLFKELELEGRNEGVHHPFLHHVNWRSCTGILHFFHEYYFQKLKWFNDIKQLIFKNRITVEELKTKCEYFLKIGNKKPAIKRYDHLPFLLPRGLFNESIAIALSKDEASMSKKNLVYLLGKFVQEDAQPFYDITRQYLYNKDSRTYESGSMSNQDQLDELKNDIEKAEKLNTRIKENDFVLLDAKRRYKSALEREKRLRQILTNDRAIMLMVQDMAGKTNEADFENWKLCDIRFPKDPKSVDGLPSNDILDRIIVMKENIAGRTVKSDRLKIKEYGKFRRFIKDRRLTNLLKYYPANIEVERLQLEEELRDYGNYRERLFEKIYRFEALMHEKYETEIFAFHQKSTEKDKPYINHKTYLNFLESNLIHKEFKNPTVKQINYLRNKFEHNEIPYDSDENWEGEPWISNMVEEKDRALTYSHRLIKLVSDVYDSLIEKI